MTVSRTVCIMASIVIGLTAVAEGQDTKAATQPVSSGFSTEMLITAMQEAEKRAKAAAEKQIGELQAQHRAKLKELDERADKKQADLQAKFDEVKDRADIQGKVHSFYTGAATWLVGIVAALLAVPSLWLWFLERRRTKNFETAKAELEEQIRKTERSFSRRMSARMDIADRNMGQTIGNLQDAVDRKIRTSEDFLKAHMSILQGQAMASSGDEFESLWHHVDAVQTLIESPGFEGIANALIPAVEGMYFACINMGTGVAIERHRLRHLLGLLGKIEVRAAGTDALGVIALELEFLKETLQTWHDDMLGSSNPGGEPIPAPDTPAGEGDAEQDEAADKGTS